MDQRVREECAQLYAHICSGLSDPTRIMIVYLLAEHAYNVGELAEQLELPQPTVSRHLKILRERGLVNAERSGQMVYYRVSDARIPAALNLLREFLQEHLHMQSDLVAALGAEHLHS